MFENSGGIFGNWMGCEDCNALKRAPSEFLAVLAVGVFSISLAFRSLDIAGNFFL